MVSPRRLSFPLRFRQPDSTESARNRRQTSNNVWVTFRKIRWGRVSASLWGTACSGLYARPKPLVSWPAYLQRKANSPAFAFARAAHWQALWGARSGSCVGSGVFLLAWRHGPRPCCSSIQDAVFAAFKSYVIETREVTTV